LAEKEGNIHEVTTLHGRTAVFDDRRHGGEILAGIIPRSCRDGVVLGIPAGGIPVAARLAELLRLPLDVAAVSKIVLPWNSEAGYGAVAYDGTVLLNEDLLPTLGLDDAEIRKRIPPGQVLTEKFPVLHFGRTPEYPDLSRWDFRVFGEVEHRPTPLEQFMRMNETQVLKPHLNTKPKVYYANLDGEVR